MSDEEYDNEAMRLTVLDHFREASRLLDGPDPEMSDWAEARADNVATAQAHLTFASALLLARQLYRRPIECAGDLDDDEDRVSA